MLINTLFLNLLIYFYFTPSSKCAPEFDYQKFGPDYWKVKYPNSCGNGKKQSPINIISKEAVFQKELGEITFNSYDKVIDWNVTNNGITVLGFKADSYELPSISMNFMDENSFKRDQFLLTQFHFHWGYNNFQGSEHYIDDQKYPLEFHLVHRSPYGKLAVLAVLFELSYQNNTALNPILTAVGLDSAINSYTMATFSLESLISNDELLSSKGYFRYLGSLTIPPCTEEVIWSVLKTAIKVSPLQLEVFRRNQILTNFRDIQPLNKRIVYTNINFTKEDAINDYSRPLEY